MPTRNPTISESARLVSSAIRSAAASVSFITCGRGRGFGFTGVAGVISVIYSILAPNQCPGLVPGLDPAIHLPSYESCEEDGYAGRDEASPHIQNEPRLVGHPV